MKTDNLFFIKKYCLLIVALLFSSIGCEKNSTMDMQGDKKEYDVYQIFFDSLFVNIDLIVVLDSTLVDTSNFHPDYLSDPTYKDYYKKNKKSIGLFDFKNQVNDNRFIIVSESDVVSIIKDEKGIFWENFYKEFPGSNGLFKLSRVGFNEDSTKATMRYEHIQGELSGGVFWIDLIEENGNWNITKKYIETIF